MAKILITPEYHRIIKYRTILTPAAKDKRLEFCKANDDRNWKNVMFTDEILIKTAKHSLIVWGAITSEEILDLVVIPGRLNRQSYIDHVLIPVVKPYKDSHPNMVFQQDNTCAHKASSVERWFADNGIEKLSWPPRSSDLNIIEDIWKLLGEELGDVSNLTSTDVEGEDRLVHIIHDAWDIVRFKDPKLLTQLYRSMTRRVKLCIRKEGGALKN